MLQKKVILSLVIILTFVGLLEGGGNIEEKHKLAKCKNKGNKTQKIEILDHEISRIILKQDSKD